jgi:nucleoside-diphosphate-sugar epimerase
VVTGAAGFIGSHLCRGLVAEGHEVVGLDDLSEGRLENLADVPEVRFERLGIVEEAELDRVVRGCDVVLHHAARKSVARSIEEPEAFHRVNVLGTLDVLEAARAEGAAVVFASSSSVYGDQERFPLTEDMEPRPRSPYAATKLAGEAYCRAWSASMGVPTISLRYFNVYGPGQDPDSPYAAVIPRFATACLTGSRPVIHGDGEQSRDFTYVDDVVEANLLASRMPEAARGRVLNAGGGRPPTSVNGLLAAIGTLAGTTPDPVHEPAREGDIRRSEADITLARTLIGYEPKVAIDEGLRRTVDSFRAAIVDEPG